MCTVFFKPADIKVFLARNMTSSREAVESSEQTSVYREALRLHYSTILQTENIGSY